MERCSTKRQRQGKEKRNSSQPSGTESTRDPVDRVWMPSHHCCSGRVATGESEIVIDARVATGMEISLGDSVTIGAGNGRMNFTVVGIGLHSNHLYYAQDGGLFPAEPGTFATGYLSSEGLERLANMSSGSSNLL